MPHYTAPLRDMQFVLFDLLQAESELAALPRHAGLDRETIEAVLEEGAKFASQVIQPLNAVGDREGCTFHGDGVVTAPAGFREAYRQFVEAGWPSVACSLGACSSADWAIAVAVIRPNASSESRMRFFNMLFFSLVFTYAPPGCQRAAALARRGARRSVAPR